VITVQEFLYHLGPPLVVAGLTIWLGRRFKQSDDKREKDRLLTEQKRIEEKTDQDIFRRKVVGGLKVIRKQNHWMSRKFVELVTIHNTKHHAEAVSLDGYPNDVIED
jgi:hypothetical protein